MEDVLLAEAEDLCVGEMPLVGFWEAETVEVALGVVVVFEVSVDGVTAMLIISKRFSEIRRNQRMKGSEKNVKTELRPNFF